MPVLWINENYQGIAGANKNLDERPLRLLGLVNELRKKNLIFVPSKRHVIPAITNTVEAQVLAEKNGKFNIIKKMKFSKSDQAN